MINFRYIANIIGKILWVESFFMLVCFVVALYYKESDISDFLYSFIITAITGTLMVTTMKAKEVVISRKDGYFIVASTWIVISLFGTLPYLFGDTIPNAVDAIFESVSGFTTTGSSIINNIEELSRATLLWRSITQWLGGLGIVVLFIAILPGLGAEGRDLYVAEVTGPTHDKFTTTFASTAQRMWILYISLTALQCLLLTLGDMDLFDAICHSLTTMATGGYSTKQASVAYWDSAYIQYIFIIFMFLAGTNFGLMFFVLLGKPGKLFKDEEFRLYTSIIILATIIVAIGLYLVKDNSIELSIRDALFQVVTIITSTGYTTNDYLTWPPLLGAIIFMLMFIGGCAGSTAGGMKVIRLNLLFKNSLIELKRIIHPHAVINVKYNKKSVHPGIITGVMGFFVLYMLIFGISSLIISYFTNDITTAVSAVLSSMSNIGSGFGEIGPMNNFSTLPNTAKLLLSALMLIGRLEIFTILVLFTRSFWRE